MSRIKYDVTDVEGGADFKLAPIGIYKCEITQCEDAKPEGKARRLEMIYKIIDTDENYGQLYDYINLESEAASFRIRQLVDALGKKAKGELDTAKIVGEEILVRVKHETYNGEVRAKPGSLLPLVEDEEGEDQEDLDDEDSDDEAYEDMPVAALREECKERGIKSTGKKEVVVARLEKHDEEEGEDESESAEDNEEDDDDSEEDESYDSWELSEIKEELKERGLKTAGKKSVLVARLEKDDEADEDPF